jgi:hypothetical protein
MDAPPLRTDINKTSSNRFLCYWSIILSIDDLKVKNFIKCKNESVSFDGKFISRKTSNTITMEKKNFLNYFIN